MSTVKRIVCLANSRKLSGRCIAGKELVEGRPAQWIRLVRNRDRQEVSEHERQYKDGTDPENLDIIDIPLLGAHPQGYQQENWLLDPSQFWSKVGRFQFDKLPELVDQTDGLWIDGEHTRNVLNDRVPIHIAAGLTTSLKPISVDALALSVFSSGEAFGDSKRRVQAQFGFAEKEYRMWVTDPRYECRHLQQPDGRHHIRRCCLTISLGEAYKGYAYKLVAAIIEHEGTDRRGEV
ncbi:MAG: hypothetical protein JO309_02760 [Pseudonocardiales bacterium]|nr:hypothetical protein [Pseudonocardiales bacterium]